jgi:hypothetical protein
VATDERSNEAGVRSVPMTDSDPDGVRWAMTIVVFCAFLAILTFLVPFRD